MLYIGFVIRNPWSKRFAPVGVKAYSVTKNKSIELGIYKTSGLLGFGFNIDSYYFDHAGFSLDLELFGYQFDFHFYDNRHYEDRMTK